jgi:hypothetical protein
MTDSEPPAADHDPLSEHDRTIIISIRRGNPHDPFDVVIDVDPGTLDCYAARTYLYQAYSALDPEQPDEYDLEEDD